MASSILVVIIILAIAIVCGISVAGWLESPDTIEWIKENPLIAVFIAWLIGLAMGR